MATSPFKGNVVAVRTLLNFDNNYFTTIGSFCIIFLAIFVRIRGMQNNGYKYVYVPLPVYLTTQSNHLRHCDLTLSLSCDIDMKQQEINVVLVNIDR